MMYLSTFNVIKEHLHLAGEAEAVLGSSTGCGYYAQKFKVCTDYGGNFRLSQLIFDVRPHVFYWAVVFNTKHMWPCYAAHAVRIISGRDKNLMKSEESSSNEAPVKVQPGRGCLRSVIRLEHVRFLPSGTFSAKTKPSLCRRKFQTFQKAASGSQSHSLSQTSAELTCSYRTPAEIYAEIWEEYMKALPRTSAREKRKNNLVQKEIYSTSDILLHRSHLSYWVTTTFLFLLRADWRRDGCCGLVEKRGGNVKADVF